MFANWSVKQSFSLLRPADPLVERSRKIIIGLRSDFGQVPILVRQTTLKLSGLTSRASAIVKSKDLELQTLRCFRGYIFLTPLAIGYTAHLSKKLYAALQSLFSLQAKSNIDLKAIELICPH